MLTIKDIQKLMETFATKYDLERFATKEDLQEVKNQVLDRMDAVYKELVNMRMDNATHMQSHRDIAHELKKSK